MVDSSSPEVLADDFDEFDSNPLSKKTLVPEFDSVSDLTLVDDSVVFNTSVPNLVGFDIVVDDFVADSPSLSDSVGIDTIVPDSDLGVEKIDNFDVDSPLMPDSVGSTLLCPIPTMGKTKWMIFQRSLVPDVGHKLLSFVIFI
ncbi:hypothetical protein ACS0TY_006905 [Phlomoides rotata]